jgi:transposase
LELHHLYRAMAFLGEALEEPWTLGSPRCVKDAIEESLFESRRDLFSEVDLVFFDTTSIYFEGQGGETLGQFGHSKDHRPDLRQMIVGFALDAEGCPLCCEMWPGNTTDVTTLLPVVERLKKRFRVREVCIVADRGMICEATVQALEAAEPPVRYILGARMRRQKEVSEEVLRSHGVWTEITPERKRAKDPSPLKVREVKVHGHRYLLCLNEEERRKDAADRVAIVASLREHLKQGAKSLVGNKGYRRYLAMEGQGHFAIDEKRVEDDARFDGLWVLRTNTDYEAEIVASTYKTLWTVEALIRTTKTIMETRPIWHKCDETIRGHVFCSFLALRLKVELERRLATTSERWEWNEILRGLDNLHEVEAVFRGHRFIMRSQLVAEAHKALRAAGVAVPPTIRKA